MGVYTWHAAKLRLTGILFPSGEWRVASGERTVALVGQGLLTSPSSATDVGVERGALSPSLWLHRPSVAAHYYLPTRHSPLATRHSPLATRRRLRCRAPSWVSRG